MLDKMLYFVWCSMAGKDCPSRGLIFLYPRHCKWGQTCVGHWLHWDLRKGEHVLREKTDLCPYPSFFTDGTSLHLGFIGKMQITDCKFVVRIKQENVFETLAHRKHLVNGSYISSIIPKPISSQENLLGCFTETLRSGLPPFVWVEGWNVKL